MKVKDGSPLAETRLLALDLPFLAACREPIPNFEQIASHLHLAGVTCATSYSFPYRRRLTRPTKCAEFGVQKGRETCIARAQSPNFSRLDKRKLQQRKNKKGLA